MPQNTGNDPADNPGRLNRFDLGAATVLVDFAHNPDGFDALFEAAAALPAERRLVLLGQSGDRERASTEGMARACVEAGRLVSGELSACLSSFFA